MSRYYDDMVEDVAFALWQHMSGLNRLPSPPELAKTALKAAGIVVPAKDECICLGGPLHGKINPAYRDRGGVMLASKPMKVTMEPLNGNETPIETVRYDRRRLGPYPCEFWVLEGLSDEAAAYLVPAWLKG